MSCQLARMLPAITTPFTADPISITRASGRSTARLLDAAAIGVGAWTGRSGDGATLLRTTSKVDAWPPRRCGRRRRIRSCRGRRALDRRRGRAGRSGWLATAVATSGLMVLPRTLLHRWREWKDSMIVSVSSAHRSACALQQPELLWHRFTPDPIVDAGGMAPIYRCGKGVVAATSAAWTSCAAMRAAARAPGEDRRLDMTVLFLSVSEGIGGGAWAGGRLWSCVPEGVGAPVCDLARRRPRTRPAGAV